MEWVSKHKVLRRIQTQHNTRGFLLLNQQHAIVLNPSVTANGTLSFYNGLMESSHTYYSVNTVELVVPKMYHQKASSTLYAIKLC